MAIIYKYITYFFLLLVLQSCSNARSFDEISSIFKLLEDNNKELKTFSKEEIEKFEYPIIEVRTNGLIKQVLMLPISSRYNFTNYFSGSGPILTMNGAMISKTNGMNTYLNSIITDTTNPIIEKKPISKWTGFYEKKYIFLTETFNSKEISFNCYFGDKINESIEILQEKHTLAKIEEHCFNDSKRFKNTYWVDTSGFVIKSKQLISIKDVFATVIFLKV